MKKNKQKVKDTLAWAACLLFLGVSSAEAFPFNEIEGFYTGEYRNKSGSSVDVEVFVKKILDTPFGMIVEKGRQPMVGLFKIEALRDGNLAWVQISKSSDEKVLTQTAHYGISFTVTAVGQELKFVPSPDFQNCAHHEMTVDRSSGSRWDGVLEALAKTYKAGNGSKVDVSMAVGSHIGAVDGKLKVGERSVTGRLLIEEQLPNILTLRASQPKLTHSGGHVLSPTIEGFMTVITHKYSTGLPLIGGSEYRNQLIVSNGETPKLTCLQPAVILELK